MGAGLSLELRPKRPQTRKRMKIAPMQRCEYCNEFFPVADKVCYNRDCLLTFFGKISKKDESLRGHLRDYLNRGCGEENSADSSDRGAENSADSSDRGEENSADSSDRGATPRPPSPLVARRQARVRDPHGEIHSANRLSSTSKKQRKRKAARKKKEDDGILMNTVDV